MLFKNYKKIIITIIMNIMCVTSIVTLVTLSGCGKEDRKASISGGRDVMRLPDTTTPGEVKDSQNDNEGVEVVLVTLDTNNEIMVFQKIGSGKRLELTYNGGTDIRGKSGNAILATQLRIGEVVRINYSDSSGRLEKLKVSDNAWERKDISNIQINDDTRQIFIGEDKYTYSDTLVVISNDMMVDVNSIDQVDQLTLIGHDMRIDSIIITQGHGYVQLSNTAFFEGGIIEIGKAVITAIEKDMCIKVPEGSYKLTVTKDSVTGSDEVEIKRDEQIFVNLMDFQEEGKRYGSIGFLISPDNATLYIDKKKIEDYSTVVQLTYGIHSISIVCEGYKKFTTTIDVNTTYQSVEVDLQPEETNEQTTKEPAGESTAEGETAKSTERESTTSVEETTTQKATSITETTKSLADIVSNILIG